MGLMGHPIADAYQSMMAERVEVLRGPASRPLRVQCNGRGYQHRHPQDAGGRGETNAQIGYGSYNTLQTEVSNRVRKGRFSSVVTGSYNRTDGHRDDMEFEQYGGYAKLGYDFSDTWKLWGDEHHPLQRLQSRRSQNKSVYRQRLAHHTRRWKIFALENRLRPASGAVSSSITGAGTGLTTATTRRRAPEVALQQGPDAGHIVVSKRHALHRQTA